MQPTRRVRRAGARLIRRTGRAGDFSRAIVRSSSRRGLIRRSAIVEVLESISPARAEALLEWVASLNGPPRQGRLIIATTEAPHLRRVVSRRRRQHGAQPAASQGGGPPAGAGAHAHHGAGIRDGNGILFISHAGDICPSGFLEVPTGNVREDDVLKVYRASPLFRELREPEGFGGRCGRCEFHFVCGGSRARAFARSGSPLAEDPLCAYEPGTAASRVTAASAGLTGQAR